MPIKFAHIRLTKYGVKRFAVNTDQRGPDDCWPWKAKLNEDGYGMSAMGGRMRVASRVAWVIAYGEQPLGYVCHKCDNRACVNPAHLYVGDQFNNMRDMVERRRNWQAAVTHCPRGHVYSGGNLWIDKSGRRHCRECGRIACREWWARSGREYAERKRQQVTAA